jgi:hypothetical protein
VTSGARATSFDDDARAGELTPGFVTRLHATTVGPESGAIARAFAEPENTERAERFFGHVRKRLEDHPASTLLACGEHVLLSVFFDQKEPRRKSPKETLLSILPAGWSLYSSARKKTTPFRLIMMTLSFLGD